MRTVSINSTSLTEIFQELQAQLCGKLEINAKECKLEIDTEIAKGCISGIVVDNAISYLYYDIVFKEAVSIISKGMPSDSLQFAYCSKGQLVQNYNQKKAQQIGSFQTGIYSNFAAKSTSLSFTKNQQVKISIITVNVLAVNDIDLQSHLQSTFLNNQEIGVSSTGGSLNLKIFEEIERLHCIDQKGLVRNLLVNSAINLILAVQIEQYKFDLANAESLFTLLTLSELEAIKNLSDFIRKNPEIQYSLKYLCKKSGLSPLKLQEGFKILHDRTVSDFIRNVRVELAENLIRTSELNISEIVYSIGLTSRSYFSKIFKAKYNCCPKYYQNNLIMTA